MNVESSLFDYVLQSSLSDKHNSWTAHRPFAYQLVSQIRPEIIVELGTYFGESYFTFCQAVAERGFPCRCYAIDTWQGDVQGGFYHDDVYQEVARYNDLYKSFSYLLRMTFDEASKQFAEESIDLIHIDGLHTYEAVKHDLQTWLPKVRCGGIILLHDIAIRHMDFGVWRLWEEVAPKYEHFSFRHASGLGVLRKPGGESNVGSVLGALLNKTNTEEKVFLERLFTLQGEHLLDRKRIQRLEEQNSRLKKMRRRHTLALSVAVVLILCFAVLLVFQLMS